MLEISNLEVCYDSVVAIKGISLQVNPGEIVCIIGANGAGKSTTMKAVMGSAKITKGAIKLRCANITRRPSHEVVAKGVGFVPEGRRLFPQLSVIENLQMGAYTRKDRREFETDVAEVFRIFPVLKERTRQLAGTLSGGEQQMLAIGRALMSRPSLLLLDEPSLGLAPIIVEEIFKVIRQINRQGTTVLVVEQNARLALAVAHRGYVLETGRVVLEGDARSLANNPEIQQAYLGKKVH